MNRVWDRASPGASRRGVWEPGRGWAGPDSPLKHAAAQRRPGPPVHAGPGPAPDPPRTRPGPAPDPPGSTPAGAERPPRACAPRPAPFSRDRETAGSGGRCQPHVGPLPPVPPPPPLSSWAGRAAGTTGRRGCRRAPRSLRPPPSRWNCRWSWEVRRVTARTPCRGRPGRPGSALSSPPLPSPLLSSGVTFVNANLGC